MPLLSAAFFAQLDASSFALLSEATRLPHIINRFSCIEDGLIWAAVRAEHAGLVSGTPFRTFLPSDVERIYQDWYKPNKTQWTHAKVEYYQSYNCLGVLPHRCLPGRCPLDWARPISAEQLLAGIIEEENYEMTVNAPFWENKVDPRQIAGELRGSTAFSTSPALQVRGTIQPEQKLLYAECIERAQYAGSWLITDLIAKASAMASGLLEVDDETALDWAEYVKGAKHHVEHEKCCYLKSFPGPRPWTAAAASLLVPR
ncbi:MAG TPA: hypothetical protein VMD30_12010 [Tepidisphaeraceae bacterium]|nr:hypothetical protein [Tepidisphaeraceae bacterium]